MTLFASRRLPQAAFVALAALGLVFGVARTAHAFTYAPANSVSPDGSANLQDPDAQFSSDDNGSNGSTLKLPGGATLNFGTQDAQDNYSREYNRDVERLFNPVGTPGGPDGR